MRRRFTTEAWFGANGLPDDYYQTLNMDPKNSFREHMRIQQGMEEDQVASLFDLHKKYGTKGLELCTVQELKQECRGRNLKGFSSKPKHELVEMVANELADVSRRKKRKNNPSSEEKKRKAQKTSTGVQHFVLKMILKPHSVWRSMRVPATWSLEKTLEEMLDKGFAFHDFGHLFTLVINGTTYLSSLDIDDEFELKELRDQKKRADRITLQQMNLTVGDSMQFLFDYGDDWNFTIYVEKEENRPREEKLTVLAQSKKSPPPQYFVESEPESEPE